MLDRAFDAGINLLDTGDIYAEGEGERIIGRALKANGRRHSTLISTKVDHVPGVNLDFYTPGINPNHHGHSRLNIIRACEEALARLQTDYIDLYQMHRPSPETPIDETLGALTDLVRQGKVRYVGCSTHPAWMVMEALMTSELKGYVRYVSEQPPYNLLDRRIENELIPMCQKWGLGIISWAPMAQGILSGRYAADTEYPEGSRAALRGGYYARSGDLAGNRGRSQARRDRERSEPDLGAAGCSLVQGTAGDHGAAGGASNSRAARATASGDGDGAQRRAARGVRRAGAAREASSPTSTTPRIG